MQLAENTANIGSPIDGDLVNALLAHAPTVLFLIDADGSVRYASPAARSLSGLSGEHWPIDGSPLKIDPLQVPTARTAAEAAIKHPGEPQQFEILSTYSRWLQCTITSRLDDPKVRALVVNVEDITARKRAEVLARDALSHDAATGLPNHLAVEAKLAERVAAADRAHLAAISLISIEGITNLTCDTDVIMRAIAIRLIECIGDEGWLARQGKTEFVVIHASLQSAEVHLDLGRRMQAVFGDEFQVDGADLLVNASIGVAAGSPESKTTADGLVAQADMAMHAAKRTQDRTCIYDHHLHVNTTQRLMLTRSLAHPDRSGLQLEPAVIIDTERLHPVAERLRPVWRHPQLGDITRADLDADCLYDFDLWLLDVTVSHYCAVGASRLIVPLSLATVTSDSFVDRFGAQLIKHDCQPSDFVIELSESDVARRPQQALASVRRLYERGLRICIGDFRGESLPFAWLAQFPATYLHVNARLLEHHDIKYAAALVGFANSIGIEPIAGGGLSPRHAKALRSAGLALAEGKPTTSDTIVAPSVELPSPLLPSR